MDFFNYFFFFFFFSIRNDQEDLKLNWKKEKEFSEKGLKAIYEEKFKGKDSLTASLQNFTKNEKLMYKPYPLNTIFLQKLSSNNLNFSSDKTMLIAEKLYNKGFISYPRTETNTFSKSINLFSLISNLSQHLTLGMHISSIKYKKKENSQVFHFFFKLFSTFDLS